MEERGRCRVSEPETRLLSVTKRVHAVLITISIPLGVVVAGYTGNQDYGKAPSMVVFSSIGGLVEAWIHTQNGAEVGLTIGLAMAAPLVGVPVCFGLCGGAFGAILGAPYQ